MISPHVAPPRAQPHFVCFAMPPKISDIYYGLYEDYAKKYGKIALLYNNGKFYEIYGGGEENKTNIHLISKETGLRISSVTGVAGFPVTSKKYIKTFIDHNYTVIIYTQQDIENSKKKYRTLEKIISPGTYCSTDSSDNSFEDIPVEDEENNIMCILSCVVDSTYEINVSMLDVVTGRCFLFSIINEKKEAFEELTKIISESNPREILLSSDDSRRDNSETDFMKLFDERKIFSRKITPDKEFHKIAYQDEFFIRVFPHFAKHHISPVEFMNIENYPLLTVCLVTLINFVYEQDSTILARLSKPILREVSDSLQVSNETMSKLNLFNSLSTSSRSSSSSINSAINSVFDIINMTFTAMGRRNLKNRLQSPMCNPDILNKRYNDIDFFIQRKKYIPLIENQLKNIYDLEKFHRKIFTKKLVPKEFSVLNESYSSILKIINFMKKYFEGYYYDNFNAFKQFVLYYRKYIDFTENGEIFNQGLFSDLDVARLHISNSMKELETYANDLSKIVGEPNGVNVGYMPSEGYFLETTQKRFNIIRDSLKECDVKKSNGIRMSDNKIKKLSEIILKNKEIVEKLNKKYFADLLNNITEKYSDELYKISSFIAEIDVIVSCAKTAILYKYCKPQILPSDTDSSYIAAKDARHIIVERINEKEKFVANDIMINSKSESKNSSSSSIGMILFGLNGSGKSIYIKSVCINIILAQCGFYVPCREFKFNPFEKLITKIVADDNLYKNQSTFIKEMKDLGDMLSQSNKKSLIIADELCAGTTTFDAISIVSSAIHELATKEIPFIFTTHLHQLKNIKLVTDLKNVEFYHLTVSFSDTQIIYGRKLQRGQSDSVYGIEIANHLKIGSPEFIKNAMMIRNTLVSDVSKTQKSDESVPLYVLPTKVSNYNNKVYVDKCVECGSTEKLQTDHIEPQMKSDENGMIGTFHKNSKFNLQNLCENCHKKKTLVDIVSRGSKK